MMVVFATGLSTYHQPTEFSRIVHHVLFYNPCLSLRTLHQGPSSALQEFQEEQRSVRQRVRVFEYFLSGCDLKAGGVRYGPSLIRPKNLEPSKTTFKVLVRTAGSALIWQTVMNSNC